MQNILQYNYVGIIVRRGDISSKLVAFCTIAVGILTLSFTLFRGYEIFSAAVVYFIVCWLFPAGYYIQGIDERNESKLLWWIISVSFHLVGMVIFCVIVLNPHTESDIKMNHTLATALLCLLPVFLIPVLLPALVYANMRKNLQAVLITGRPVVRSPRVISSSDIITASMSSVSRDMGSTSNRRGREDEPPPTYEEAHDANLPSYEDLETRRISIGKNVVVVDKDFQVSSFKNMQHV